MNGYSKKQWQWRCPVPTWLPVLNQTLHYFNFNFNLGWQMAMAWDLFPLSLRHKGHSAVCPQSSDNTQREGEREREGTKASNWSKYYSGLRLGPLCSPFLQYPPIPTHSSFHSTPPLRTLSLTNKRERERVFHQFLWTSKKQLRPLSYFPFHSPFLSKPPTITNAAQQTPPTPTINK